MRHELTTRQKAILSALEELNKQLRLANTEGFCIYLESNNTQFDVVIVDEIGGHAEQRIVNSRPAFAMLCAMSKILQGEQ